VPHSPLMNPIGEGEGAAWASLYIHVLWFSHSRGQKFKAQSVNLVKLFLFVTNPQCILHQGVDQIGRKKTGEAKYVHRGVRTSRYIHLRGVTTLLLCVFTTGESLPVFPSSVSLPLSLPLSFPLSPPSIPPFGYPTMSEDLTMIGIGHAHKWNLNFFFTANICALDMAENSSITPPN
jgi:hypothetical protein